MSNDDLNENKIKKMKKLLSKGNSKKSFSSSLQTKKVALGFGYANYQFLPTFWTIANVMLFTINNALLIILAIVLQKLHALGISVTGASDNLLGGLYANLVKLNPAYIKTNMPFSKEIPVQFTLNVSGNTNVILSQDVSTNGALANIVLPAGTTLPIFIENLVIPVDQKILTELSVAIDIPINQTELHEPLVGLRKLVGPYYCLLNPKVFVNVCATAVPILPVVP